MTTLTAQQRAVMVAASLAVGLAFLDETAVVTALPAIQRDFGLSTPGLQWVMGAYLLALASLMAAAGRLADVHGRRRLFLAGTAVFGAGSVIAALAPTAVALVGARAVQGVGAALLVPLGYANATIALPDERRGWALGVVSTGATVLLALGPLIGGTLTEAVGWRAVFAVNVLPVAVIAVLATRALPESRADRREPVDVAGLVLLVCGLGALATVLLQVQAWGATSPAAIVAACAAIALLAAFVALQARRAHPLVDLSLVRVPAVTGSLAALFAIQFAILGLTVYLTLYLQHVLGYGPAFAGLLTLPAVALAPFLSVPVGRRTDRAGARALTVGGLALAALALLAIAAVAGERAVALLLVPLLAFGVARPTAAVAGTAGTIGAIPAGARGLASALATQSRQIGAVLGVAALGLVVTAAEAAQRTTLLHSVDASFDSADRAALDALVAGGERGDALLAGLSPTQRSAAVQAAGDAYVHGFEIAMLVAAGVLLAGTAAAAALIRSRPEAIGGAPQPDATAAGVRAEDRPRR